MLVLLLVVSTISGILAVAGLPSAVDAEMFLLSLLLLASLHAVAGFTVFAFYGVYAVLAVLLLLSFPAIFVIDLLDANKKLGNIFNTLFLLITF